MKNAAQIFRFLIDAAARGEKTALVTVIGVIGSSSRAPGTHMAVSGTGASVGSLSGGCVEAAVVGEALRVMEGGTAELIRFGAGSRFIDIRLPCGGGLDLLITPAPPLAVLEQLVSELEARRPITLVLSPAGGMTADAVADRTGWHHGQFRAVHRPDMRVIVVGHGAETPALARLAQSYGADVVVLSPDERIVAAMHDAGTTAHRLTTPAASPHLAADPDSAVVFLFHDHDWETALLAQVLDQQPFFIGAMGSRTTQRRRLEALRGDGVGEAGLARVQGPIGLIPATRDPDTLALSVLAQLVERYQARSAAGSAEADAGPLRLSA